MFCLYTHSQYVQIDPRAKSCVILYIRSKTIFISKVVVFMNPFFLANLTQPAPSDTIFPSANLFPSVFSESCSTAPLVLPQLVLDPTSIPSISHDLDRADSSQSLGLALVECISYFSFPSSFLQWIILQTSTIRSVKIHKPQSLHDYHCNLASNSTAPDLVSLPVASPLPGSLILSHILYLILNCLPSTMPLPLLSLPMLNLNSITRQFNILIGEMPQLLKQQQPWKQIILGMSLLYLLESSPLVVNGFTKLNTKLMEVLRGIKLVYFETFCPVAKFAQWCLLALSTVNQWHLIQHDVTNAFLHDEA